MGHGEHGFSILEVLVAVTALSMLIGGVLTMLGDTQVLFEREMDQSTLLRRTRIAGRTIEDSLRWAGYRLKGAPEGLIAAGPTSVTIAGDVDNGAADPPCGAALESLADAGSERVAISLSLQGELVEQIDCWNSGSWQQGRVSQVLAVDVQSVLFRFFDDSDVEILGNGTGGALDAGQRESVRTIAYDLRLRGVNVLGNTSFALTGRLRLRNLD